jgi:hypothetical protein
MVLAPVLARKIAAENMLGIGFRNQPAQSSGRAMLL